jgi:hypothetical protein
MRFVPLSCPLLRPQRYIDFSGHPETMKEDGKLAGNSDDCSLLCCLATAGGMSESPAPQVGVWSPLAEDVMRAVDQDLTEILVACLRYSQLRRLVT